MKSKSSKTWFKVQLGHDRKGRERNRYFPTLAAAQPFLQNVFARTGCVLSVIEVKRQNA